MDKHYLLLTTGLITILVSSCLVSGCIGNSKMANYNPEKRIISTVKAKYYPSDSSIEEYVSRVAKRILIVSNRPSTNYRFQVKEYAGGPLVVDFNNNSIILTKQLLQQLNNEAELAYILGHSILLLNTKNRPWSDLKYEQESMQLIARAGYNPQSAIDIQERIGNSSTLNTAFKQHLPTREHINQNKKLTAKLPKGLQTGASRYKQQIGI